MIECKDCPHRKHYNDGHWSTELCDHPRAPGVYENHIKGRAYNNTLVTPDWCPKRLGLIGRLVAVFNKEKK
jgi:hypothetical protein